MGKWTDKQLIEVQELHDGGMGINDISKAFGVSRQRMYQVFKHYNLIKRRDIIKDTIVGRGIKYKWLNTKLIQKGFSEVDRLSVLKDLDVPDICPILTMELNYGDMKETLNYYTPYDCMASIDRINPNRGYTPCNIHIISLRANKLKGNATWYELTAVANYMKYIDEKY